MVCKPTNELVWTNDDLFDGYIVVVAVWPAGSNYSRLSQTGRLPRVDLPRRITIPVVKGVPDPNCGIWSPEDLEPPNTAYAWYAVDKNLVQVAGPSAIFSPTTPSFALPALTLTAPAAGSTIPTL